MADEKTIILTFGVPESVYHELDAIAQAKDLRLDQLLPIAVGAGLLTFLKRD